MAKAHIDTETRSTVNLQSSGAFTYFEHPMTEVILLSWRIGDGPVNLWRPGDPDPEPLISHIAAGGIVVAHNMLFDRLAWNMKLPAHWPKISIEQSRCTAARSKAAGRPESLADAAASLKCKQSKDMGGRRLMLKMCKPRRVSADGSIVWWDDPRDHERLGLYAAQDIVVESDIDSKLPELTDKELEVWFLDQRINERGIKIDIASVEKAAPVVARAYEFMAKAIRDVTDGVVSSPSEVAKLRKWLEGRGIDCAGLDKENIDKTMVSAAALDDKQAIKALEIRGVASTTSVSKFKKMLSSASSDSRVRGALSYHGALTGRWAGRLIQPQNFVRVSEEGYENTKTLLRLLSASSDPDEVVDMIEAIIGNPFRALADSMRAMVVADVGKKFVSGDYSNIEGRVGAYVSGQAWKVKAFKEFDDGSGPDLYRLSYAKSFGVPIDQVPHKGIQRQIGKVRELALMYQGGVGAYLKKAVQLGTDPVAVSKSAKESTDPALWEMTSEKYERSINYGLPIDVWTGVRCDIESWRKDNSGITSSWTELENAALYVMSKETKELEVLGGMARYYCEKDYLVCALNSGGIIRYPDPQIIELTIPLSSKKKKSVAYGDGEFLYGGKQFNHIVQRLARDILVEAMLRLENRGYPIVLTVHDSVVAEVDRNFGSPEELSAIMCEPLDWCKGLPLAVDAWQDSRYAH